MRIVIICEGKSELALKVPLKRYLDALCSGSSRPRLGLDFRQFRGSPNCDQLRRYVDQYGDSSEIIGVIGLIDVYPRYRHADEAKEFMKGCIAAAAHKTKFYAHVAQMELEAWLLPYWHAIAKRLGVSAKPPGADAERVDGVKPPSVWLKELYSKARGKRYDKYLEASRLFDNYGLEDSAKKCSQLRSLLDTLAELATRLDRSEQ